MNSKDKTLVIIMVFMFLFLGVALYAGHIEKNDEEQTKREAIKAGLVQKVENNNVVWIKP